MPNSISKTKIKIVTWFKKKLKHNIKQTKRNI